MALALHAAPGETRSMSFRWGIFGTGAVSARFAAGLAQLGDHRVALVASRREEQARAFAAAFAAPDAVAGYDEAAAIAPAKVDAIYIATPPSLHAAQALACLRAGFPVLVEKPFAHDAAAAHAVADAACAAHVFAMEAMWSRFMPAFARLRALLAEGAIGEPRLVSGSFGISNAVDPAYGNFDPARGGGALAHLGYYPVALAQALFGDPVRCEAVGRRGATGVEEDVAISLAYRDGAIGAFHASLRAPLANDFAVHGTHGSLTLLGPLYRPWGVRIERAAPRRAPSPDLSRKALLKEGALYNRLGQWKAMARGGGGKTERHPYAGNGYHYQAAEVAACIRAGRTQSALMPLADSVAVAATLDALRGQVAR